MSHDSAKNYYPFLDGFRAIAVLWVLFHHATYHFNFESLFGPLARYIVWVGYLGFLGVDIFFVISGFLITGLLIDDLNTKVRVKRFYCRRFFKIVPHYTFVIFISLAFLLFLSPGDIHGAAVRYYFCFLQNYLGAVPALSHLWSIAVEEHFYFLYPLVLAAITRLSPSPKARRELLFFILMGLLFAGSYIRYRAWMGLTDSAPWPTQMSHVRFDGLIFGCLLRVIEPHLAVLRLRAKEILAMACFAVSAILWGSFYLKFDKIGWGYYTAVYLAAGFMVLSARLGFRPLLWFAEGPRLRWVGKNSYGIYLWHYPLLKIFFPVYSEWPKVLSFGVLPVQAATAAGIVLYVISAIGLGHVTTATIERHFLDLRKKVFP